MSSTPSAGRCRGDAGAATLWMVFAVTIVFAVAGLVFDGGNLISTKREAVNDAEEAARAGAQAIDISTVLGAGGTQLDPAAATARAQQFLATNGWAGTVTADTQSITVTVTLHRSMTFLQTFGLGERTINGTATARPQTGFAGP